jgi:3-hydroxyacyl-[acyl-carrier-protein] dehydratase
MEGKAITEERNGRFQRRALEEALNRLAHPYPTLMIDRVNEVEQEKTIRTTKWVSADEFYLTGHFPGEPIMPGVLTLEGLIQSALILVDESFSRGRLKCSLEKVDRVRFKRAVIPGDQVDFQLQLTAKDESLWRFKGKAQVGKETTAEADLTLRVTYRDVGFEV